MSVPSGLQFFYELVQKLNSTLDLDVVLAQVIEQVNRFLQIDATSISLLDPNTKELVIQMTIGKETDPQPGLRLPPYAGIAGWVVHHAEPVLIADVQQDPRFYPAVDQRTNFTSRAMICVPLIARGRPIGVIQAISKTPGIFSRADLCFMVTLAEVTALHIENARLYSVEHKARLQAETLRQIAEIVHSSLNLQQILPTAMAILRNIVPFDRMTVAVLRNGGENLYQHLTGGSGRQRLSVIATHGPEQEHPQPADIPVSELPLFQQMMALKQPIDITDVHLDRRYPRRAGREQVRSWLGVPLLAENQVIGQIVAERYEVNPFTVQEIEIMIAFAQHIAVAITNARLYTQARDRADDLAILNSILLALNGASCALEETLSAVIDVLVILFHLQAVAILLPDKPAKQLRLCVQRGFEPESIAQWESVSIRDHLVAHQVVTSSQTVVSVSEPQKDQSPTVYIWVPLVSHDQVVGVLMAEHGSPRAFSVQDMSLLEAIGRQIGATIRQIEYAAETDELRRHLESWATRAEAMLYRANLKGKVEALSLAVEAVTGYESKSLLDIPDLWKRLIHHDDIEAVEAMRQQVIAGQSRGECTYRVIKKDGSLRAVREWAAPVHDPSGQVTGIEGLIVVTSVGRE